MNRSPINRQILFVHNAPSRFVQIDLILLSKYYQVTELYEHAPDQIRPLRTLSMVKAHDLVFCWFASWHSLLPVLLARIARKPSIVVIGGYDTANLPEAGYGSQRVGLQRFLSRLVIKLATHLVAFSHSAKREAIVNAKANSEKITVIYLGLPFSPTKISSNRDNLAMTVGNVWQENLLRKGLLPFVQSASYLPDIKFVLVGKWRDESIETLRKVASANVEFTGFISDEDLLNLYKRASVYVQASLHEGFGMSVAEAMLAGCIPVVTCRGSLPEVVGDNGVYAVSNTPEAIADAVSQALNMPVSIRQRARKRIITQFPLEKRLQALYTLVDPLII